MTIPRQRDWFSRSERRAHARVETWFDLDYASALYGASQIALAGGNIDELDSIADWLARNEGVSAYGYVDWPFELMKDIGADVFCYCGESSRCGRLCWECAADADVAAYADENRDLD